MVFFIVALLWSFVWICTAEKSAFILWAGMLLAIQIPLIVFFWSFVAESDPALATSPCGKSSCSAQIGQDAIPYNPNGWYTGIEHYLRCPYKDCRWGDSNGIHPIGYPLGTDGELNLTTPCVVDTTCNWLATSRGEDYPDPGKGLTKGYVPGTTTVEDIDVCPMVDYTRNKGKHVCSHCSLYMSVYHGFGDDIGGCPSSTENLMCFWCIDATRQTLNQRYWTFYVMLIHWCGSFLIVWLVGLSQLNNHVTKKKTASRVD